MKVLSVHNRYQQPGGEDGSTAQERALLIAHGHEVLEYEEHNDRIECMSNLRVALRTIWSVETYRNIRRLIQKEHPDIVHVQNFFPLVSPSIFWACHKEQVPVVLHIRNFRLLCPSAYLYFKGQIYEDNLGMLFPWKAVKDAVYRDSRLATLTIALMLFIHRIFGTWSKKVNAYITLTEFQRKKMIEGGIPADKIFVKSNFLADLDQGELFDKGIHLKDSAIVELNPYYLFVGRLSDEKGCDVLINAWREFRKDWIAKNEKALSEINHGPQLKIVGDGPDGKKLKKLAAEEPSIQFLGRQRPDQVLHLAQGALALIFPSVWYEGMPRTIIESFSVSTPVISSNIGSMREMISNQKTGLLFKAGNEIDLTDKLLWAFEHLDEMEEMGDAARLDFEQKYSAEVNYKELMNIYEKASRNS